MNNDLTAAPALARHRGYFPLDGDRLAAYDIRYGTLLWIADGRSDFAPVVGDRQIFLIDGKTLIALSEDTGVVAWRVSLPETLVAPPTWYTGWLVGTAASGSVAAFRASDGGLIWRQELGAPIHGSAAIGADRVYVPMKDGRIVALNLDTGEGLWERRLGEEPNDILALDDRIFVGSNDNFFYSIRTRDGEVLWRWPTGADVIGRPIVDAERVYFVSLDNVVRSLDQKTGNQRWKRVLGLRPTRGLVAIDDLVVVSGLAADAPTYLMKNGAPAGNIPAQGELAALPHLVGGDALPLVVLVTRDIAYGTVVRSVTRSVEPKVDALSPLPNPIIPVIPTLPSAQ